MAYSVKTPEDIEYDEFCDPNNPRKIHFDDILEASKRISGFIEKTPCVRARISNNLGMEVFYKLETRHSSGCFKDRGVLNALLQLDEPTRRAGVISASIGNYGVALGIKSGQFGIPCIVVMPFTTPAVKVHKAREYGANIVLHGTNYHDAIIQAKLMRRDKKMLYLSGSDHPNVLEGHGTVGLEVLEQVPNLDAILVPVGGGGLLAGVATVLKWIKPKVLIYGVCTDQTTTVLDSFKKNERLYCTTGNTVADALAIHTVGVNTFCTLKGLYDRIITVHEDWVAKAIMHLVSEEKLIVEGGGAVTVAALLAGSFPNLRGKTVACLLTGGNLDNICLSRCIERGLGCIGQMIKFRVTVRDQTGATFEIASRLGAVGASIRDCMPQRCWMNQNAFNVEMIIVCETRGWDHSRQVMEMVKKNFKNTYFLGMEEPPLALDIKCRGACMPQPQITFGL